MPNRDVEDEFEGYYDDLIKIDDDRRTIDTGFCFAVLLNHYQRVFFSAQGRHMTDEEHQLIMDFAIWLEKLFKVCDGDPNWKPANDLVETDE